MDVRTSQRWVPGGEFAMGSDDHYPDEGPVRRVAVDGFWMDAYPITNRHFADFIEDTGYTTVAELPPSPELYPGAPPEDLVPGSMVFEMSSGPVDLRNHANWRRWTPGAQWRHPTGPGSDLDGLDDHPVVQVSYIDALAY
jgi:sulfatase modifying factor 1